MWMWGLCAKGMENSIVKISLLKNYRNQQVIINKYQNEDELTQREGFVFKKVQLAGEMLSFIINEHNSFTIQLVESAKLYKDESFQNFFVLENDTQRLEIYFP